MDKSRIITTALSTYEVKVKRGILNELKDLIQEEQRVFIVCDRVLENLYLETVQAQCKESEVYLFDASEEHKSMETVQSILEAMTNYKMRRSDLVIALGGGITGDVTGLCAALYMRGIDYIAIPTTSLSQIDSSVGGKVAVNGLGFKNLYGQFYHPTKVLIDPDLLKSCENRLINAGLIEALKMGITSNRKLYDMIINEDDLEDIIFEAIKTKADVVESDEFDTGARNILNFGHTLAHALESKYKIMHGEAVFIGMYYGMISEDIRNDLLLLNEKYQINLDVDFDEDLLDRMLLDKKNINESFNEVLVEEIGNGKLKTLSFDEIKEHYHV